MVHPVKTEELTACLAGQRGLQNNPAVCQIAQILETSYQFAGIKGVQ
jgi:hypothetical protein